MADEIRVSLAVLWRASDFFSRSPVLVLAILLSVGTSCGQTNETGWNVSPIPSAEFGEMFTLLKHRHSEGPDRDQLFQAYLFEPRPLDRNKKYPLIIWLHGNGHFELNHRFGALKWLPRIVFPEPKKREQYQFFLLAPHLTDPGGWIHTGYLPNAENTGGNSASSSAVVEFFLNRTIQSYPIDENRISITGCSSGAAGAWHWALCNPDRFSAVAPISSGCNVTRFGQMTKLPIWAFANRGDRVYENVVHTVATINNLGGNAYLTTFNRKDHDAWTAAFLGESRLLEWLLGKSRTDPPSFAPPGGDTLRRARLRLTQLWHHNRYALFLIIVAIIVMGVILTIFRRQRTVPSKTFVDADSCSVFPEEQEKVGIRPPQAAAQLASLTYSRYRYCYFVLWTTLFTLLAAVIINLLVGWFQSPAVTVFE